MLTLFGASRILRILTLLTDNAHENIIIYIYGTNSLWWTSHVYVLLDKDYFDSWLSA